MPGHDSVNKTPVQTTREPAQAHLKPDSRTSTGGPYGQSGIELDAFNHGALRESTKPSQLPAWWDRHIAPAVPIERMRDFYALERTFLAYIRAASAFAVFGVACAQLFRLEGSIDPSLISTFFHLGKPVGAVAQGIAILIAMIGGFRAWQQQQRLLRGRVQGPSWETRAVVLAMLAVRYHAKRPIVWPKAIPNIGR